MILNISLLFLCINLKVFFSFNQHYMIEICKWNRLLQSFLIIRFFSMFFFSFFVSSFSFSRFIFLSFSMSTLDKYFCFTRPLSFIHYPLLSIIVFRHSLWFTFFVSFAHVILFLICLSLLQSSQSHLFLLPTDFLHSTSLNTASDKRKSSCSSLLPAFRKEIRIRHNRRGCTPGTSFMTLFLSILSVN